MRIPIPAVREWIFRTLQSTINLVETVILGIPILDRLHILALEYQISRLLWCLNEVRHRANMDRIDNPRTEYDMRLHGDLADDEELPFAVTIVYLTSGDTEQHGRE